MEVIIVKGNCSKYSNSEAVSTCNLYRF